MASGINKAILIGNAGKNPVIRTTTNGAKVASFPLATSESWIDKATKKRREKTEWHSIVIYVEGLVNITEKFIKKGTKLYIEGAIQTRKWVDAEGAQRTTTEIILQGYNCTLSILDKKPSSGEESEYESDSDSSEASSETEMSLEDEEDSIPF